MICHKAPFFLKRVVGILLISSKFFNITIKTPALVYFGEFKKKTNTEKTKTNVLVGSG
jgi:hypothetical protein